MAVFQGEYCYLTDLSAVNVQDFPYTLSKVHARTAFLGTVGRFELIY